MNGKGFLTKASALFMSLSLLFSLTAAPSVTAQSAGPSMLHPRLGVRPVVTGLNLPTTIAFLSSSEMLVLEKNSGIVQYVLNGDIDHAALDLAVNNFSERGLLGIALDPDFEDNHFVYLYWSCIAPPSGDPFVPSVLSRKTTPVRCASSGSGPPN